MVAYGLPVIHQSLATAPLDIKEAIDWLIRIGGKDINGKGDNCSELKQVLKAAARDKYKGARQMDYINSLEWKVEPLVNELARFLGYLDSINGSGPIHIGGSGIGRRDGHAILSDIYKRGFLICCKNETTCTSQCKCCRSGKAGDSQCDPNKCPINAVLDCDVAQTVVCGSGSPAVMANGAASKICCILSFLMACFTEGEELHNSHVKCQHCDSSKLHENCHKGCMCVHKKVISKVACRINCLIQLATTITTLYINKKVPLCLTCRHCKTCNPDGTTPKCKPCSNCDRALKGSGEHCQYCRTGQCCEDTNARNATCKRMCNGCRNCSIVRNARAFWDMLDHVSYSCVKCTQCRSTSSPQERKECHTCRTCPGDVCDDVCKNRKLFGRLIYEVLHFMVYNFGDVAYTLKGNISPLKDDCCKQRGRETECQCSAACCGNSTAGQPVCKDCEYYCICCVDEKHNGSCVCDNQCSEKLELLLRPAISGYVSAYNYKTATWEALCKEGSGKRNKCSEECTAECRCAFEDCPAEGCCSHCPKRQCAMIFCMVVPAIYRFFDYINHQIDAELCDGGGNATSQWADGLITGDTHLGELFRSCGFPSDRLLLKLGCDLMVVNHKGTTASCQLRDHKPGNLKKVLECCETLTKNIFNALPLCTIHSNASEPYRKPETVREKLLWLSGLPYSDVYAELQRTFVASMPNGRSSLPIMQLTLRMAIFTFHILEDGSHSVWQYVTQGFLVPNSKRILHYDPDPVKLLWDIYDALYDATCALTFMSKQCSVSGINSGWEECMFGKSVNLNGVTKDICQCQSGKCKPTCSHCKDVCIACRGNAKCVCCCTHCEGRPDNCVCLVRFITSNGSLTNQAAVTPFPNASYGNMAFPKEALRMVGMRGAALYDCMSGLLTGDHALFSRLLEYLMNIVAGVPENLSDYYALFLSLGMRLQMESKENGGNYKALAAEIKSSMLDTYFGAHEGIIEPVIAAVRKFYKEDSGHTSRAGALTDSSTHNTSDLMSLYGCYSGVGCVGYIYALSSGPYELFSRYPYSGTEEFSNLSTKWILCGAASLYNGMMCLTQELRTLECCHTSSSCTCNSTNSNSCDCKDCNCSCVGTLCSCGTIVKCRKMHPVLYRNGLTFHEPDMWSSRKRKCQDFSDTLNRFIGPDSMLCRLIGAIENFLWHIRLPFCIGLMILWATALCFLMYVFIGYLDRLGMRSRWVSRTPIAHPIQLFTSSMVKPMGSGGGAGAVI